MFATNAVAQNKNIWAIDINNSRVLADTLNLKNRLSKVDTLRFKFDAFSNYASTYDSKKNRYILESDTAIILLKNNGQLDKVIHKTFDLEGMEYNPMDGLVYAVAWKINTYYFAQLNIETGQLNLIRTMSDNGLNTSTLDYEKGYYYIISDSKGLFKIDLKTGVKLDSNKYFATNNCSCNAYDNETENIATICVVNGKKVMQSYDLSSKTFYTMDTVDNYGTGYFGYSSSSYDQANGDWYLNLGKAIGIKNMRNNQRMDTIQTPFNRIKNLEFPLKACYKALNTASIIIVNPICYGNHNGSISFQIKGGRPPYYYALNNSIFDTTPYFGNLKSNSYNVQIKDKNNFCTTTLDLTLKSKPAFQHSIQLVHNKCANDKEGEIKLSSKGNTAPYQYALNGDNFKSDSVITGLQKGNYQIQVADSNNCRDTIIGIAINAPDKLKTDSVSIKNLNCYGNSDAEIQLQIKGGIAPYHYSLNNTDKGTSNKAIHLRAGNYAFRITDQNNCTLDTAIAIKEPVKLDCTLAIENTKCQGDKNGKATIRIINKLQNDKYALINLHTGATINFADSITGLAAGQYAYCVENKNRCRDSFEFTILEAPPFKINAIKDTTICNGQALKYTIKDQAATNYYTYGDNGLNFNTDSFTINQAGTFIAEIKNANACTIKDTFMVQKINLNVTHDFLLPTIGFPNDTVYAVNISMPEADKKWWHINNNAYHPSFKNNYTNGFYFNDTGVYTITLQSHYKACFYALNKPIHIVKRNDTDLIDKKYGYHGPLIRAFEVYANPHDGQHFSINIDLSDTAECQLYKIDASTGTISGEQYLGKLKQRTFTTFQSLKPEVYYLKLIAGKSSKVIKVVAVF